MITFDDATNARNLPVDQTVGVFYVDGEFANEPEVRARLPHATLAGITTVPPGMLGSLAAFCDSEWMDLSASQAEDWVLEQIGRDVRLLGVYANLSRWAGGMYDTLSHYGTRIKRWCAAYDQTPSLTLSYQGRSFTFDAHQWAGNVPPGIDRNIAADDFFTPWTPPVKPSGIMEFHGSYDITTDRWSVTQTHGTAVYAGPPVTKEALLKVQVGKTATGPRVNVFRQD